MKGCTVAKFSLALFSILLVSCDGNDSLSTGTTSNTEPRLDKIAPEVLYLDAYPSKHSLLLTTFDIVIPFTERMNEVSLQRFITLNSVNGSVLNPKNALADNYSFSFDRATNIATYTQVKPLLVDTDYRLTVPLDVTDVAGNRLVSKFVVDIATARPEPDIVIPVITGSNKQPIL